MQVEPSTQVTGPDHPLPPHWPYLFAGVPVGVGVGTGVVVEVVVGVVVGTTVVDETVVIGVVVEVETRVVVDETGTSGSVEPPVKEVVRDPLST